MATSRFPGSGGGGGGGNTFSLTAATNIAAQTGVSVNGSGQAVQTWGPAPQIAGTATLFSGSGAGTGAGAFSALVVSPSTVVVYQNLFSASITAQPLSQTGGVVTAGTANSSALIEYAFPVGAGLGQVGAAVLSSTLYVLPFDDPNNSFGLSVIPATVSGNTITYGSITLVQALTGGLQSQSPFTGFIASLTSSTFAIAYPDGTNGIWIVIGTVSGSGGSATVTLGTPLELSTTGNAGVNQEVALTALSATSVLVGWQDSGTSELVVALVNISGTTPTVSGSPVSISGTANYPYVLASVTSTLAIVEPASPASAVSAYVLKVNGGTLSVGSAQAVAPNAALWFQAMSPTDVLVWGNSGIGNIYSVDATALTLTLVGALPLAASAQNSTFASGLSGNLAIVTDTNNTIYEVDTGNDVSPGFQHFNLQSYWLYTLDTTHALALLQHATTDVLSARVINVEPLNPTPPVGISLAAVSSGNPVSVTIAGAACGFSGLSISGTYYYNGDGSIGADDTGYPAGTALSMTCLKVQ